MAIEGAVRVFLSPSLLCARFLVLALLVQALLGAVFSAGDASIFVSLLCGLFGGRALYKTGGVIFEFFVL